MTILSLKQVRLPPASPSLAAIEEIPVAIAIAAPYGPAGPTIAGTSNSAALIGNTGSRTFIINEYNRAFAPGVRLRATSSDGWLEGIVTSFNPTTRQLNLTADLSQGTGTNNSWNINVAGNPGQKGDTGAQGPIGPSGGPVGPAGADGAHQGNKYTFNGAITGDPGTGKFLFNNANISIATVLSISEVDGAGALMTGLFTSLDDGTGSKKSIVRFVNQAGTIGVIGYITGALTDAGNYDTFPWQPVTSWGVVTNNTIMFLTTDPVGDQGIQGIQGIQGPVGPQGIIAEPPADSVTYGRKNTAGTGSWTPVAAVTAATTSFAPAGNIAATNVQAAIQELDSEKCNLAIVPFGTIAANTIPGAIVELDTEKASTAYVDTSINNKAVLFSAAQGLSDAQGQTGRQNIYAAPFDAMAYFGMQVNGSFLVNQFGTGWSSVTNHWFADIFTVSQFGPTGTQWNIGVSSTPGAGGLGSIASFGCAVANASLPADCLTVILHCIEGDRTLPCYFGHGAGQPFTIKFMMNSNVTGAFAIAVRNSTGTATSPDRSYVTTVTQNVAGAWETKTVTIPPDITGTWNWGAGKVGFKISISLAVGANFNAPSLNTWVAGNYLGHASCINFGAATGRTLYLSNFMVLRGSEAPPDYRIGFIHRPFAEELRLVQRYVSKTYKYDVMPGTANTDNPIMFTALITAVSQCAPSFVAYPVPMWVPPTITLYDANGGGGQITTWEPVTAGIFHYPAQVTNLGERGFCVGTNTGGSNWVMGRSILLWGHAAFEARMS